MLILGFLQPLAAAGVIGVMLVALITNHLKNGFFIFRPGEGYERLGFIYESKGRDRPVGTTNGGNLIKLAGLNCATCHAGTYRETPSSPRRHPHPRPVEFS